VTAILSHHQCVFLHLDEGIEDLCEKRIIPFLAEISSLLKCPVRQLSSKWIGHAELTALMDDLERCAKSEDRRILLVSGAYLEDQVTVCVLEALAEGFDVHLLCDVITARDRRLKPVLLLRLFQAGAVPSSLHQFLFMWHTAETDQQKVILIQKLLNEYDKCFIGHPR
jgi:hypothetical protein